MIGQLRHRVTISRPVYASDGYGGQVKTGTSDRAVWAQIEKASGSEALTDGAVQNIQNRTVIIRFTDIRPSDFLIIDGDRWNISDVEFVDDKPFYMRVWIRRDSVTGA